MNSTASANLPAWLNPEAADCAAIAFSSPDSIPATSLPARARRAFDYVNSFGGHPFEGTRRSLLESGSRGGYEKTRVGRISSVDSGQPVGQVVERRTQVVGDVTRNHPPSGRRVSIDSEIRSVFSRLRVAVLPSEIWLSSDELLESPVESVEVYPCSIYLETTVIEWMHERIEPPDRPALQSRIGSNAP